MTEKKFAEQVEAFWESGDQELLDGLRTEHADQLEQERISQTETVERRRKETAEAIVTTEEAIRSGPIGEVPGQETRLQRLVKDAEQFDAALRNLKLAEARIETSSARHTIGPWSEARTIIVEPWRAVPAAALALCELREELMDLDADAIARNADVVLTDDAQVFLQEVYFPRIVIRGIPPPGWRDSDSAIVYRRGEEDCFLLTRLLVRCAKTGGVSKRPEFRTLVLASRQNVKRGDPTIIDVQDFRLPEYPKDLPLKVLTPTN